MLKLKSIRKRNYPKRYECYLFSICDSVRDKVEEFRELIEAFFDPRNVELPVLIP